ncbi:type VI secretion system baseplate subunit TssK [Pseudofrancisella aestuarii]|uniref:Type VI secretion system baseplate subunit TssK n=1 Tax=Pseudofrancisella aestuarii TaxID=2670347 RepID=A0ABV9TAK1_9GAMM|nr:type VI secretion system baseplate subunit TssK [Pseudofrancisella aestuarii]
MFLERLYWEDGLRLDSKVLDKSDTTLAEKAAYANFLPSNLRQGIVSFDLDMESLSSGLILVKELKLYIEDKSLVLFDKTYPLSVQVKDEELAAAIPLFLNISEKVKEKEGNKYITNHLSLSVERDYNVKYSIQIALFKSNNGQLEAVDYDFPLLTLDHYLMDNLFLNMNRLVAELKAFNKFVFSISRPYASIYLSFLITRLDRELRFSEKNRINVNPLHIFNIIHDIYSLMQVSTDDGAENIQHIIYDFYKPISKFRLLIEKLFDICKHKKISNFVQFHLQGQKYICEDFPDEFFVAKRHYFVIKRKHDAPNNARFDNKNVIRITSISRNKSIVTLSLSGLKLEEVDTSMTNFAISLNNLDTLYEIKKGSEWDFVLADRSAVFSAFPESQNFEFFIAFT